MIKIHGHLVVDDVDISRTHTNGTKS